MSTLFHRFFTVIAAATDRQLVKYIEYLKEENRILRARLPQEIHTRRDERARLLKFGRPVGQAIKELISIVTPQTFYRWVREAKRQKPPKGTRTNSKRRDLRELVLRIAKETGFGYTRILGELRKLGIRKICLQTVKNIIKEHGENPGPKRGPGTWNEFLAIHAKTLWAADFFTKRVITKRGFIDLYLLVFMHLNTREVFVTSATAHPNSAWVAQQARNFLMHVADRDDSPTYLLHDRDTKFTRQFDEILRSESVNAKLLPYRSPNLNAHCERFVQTIKREALAHFIVFGEKHLNHLTREYVTYHNAERAHSSRDHLPPYCSEPPAENNSADGKTIVSRERLGGLITTFERVAA